MQLRAAIAFQTAKNIACQAFTVQPDDWRGAIARTHQQRHMIGRIYGCPERHNFGIGIGGNGKLGPRGYA
jgi:hypothetical protein